MIGGLAELRHDPCIPGGMTAITTLPALASHSPRILDELAGRGVAVVREPGESPRDHRERLDTALMALFRDTRSEESFEALYRHARSRVFEWLRWLVRQRRAGLDPVDLLQDTFVNVYRYPNSFRDERRTSFRSWVRTIAANAMRRAQAGAQRQNSLDRLEGVVEPVDGARGPSLAIQQAEEVVALREAWALFLAHYGRAFDQLSERDRRALCLVELDGHSYAEAARLLRVGSSNMKMIMLRARRRLQKHMRASMGTAAEVAA